MKKVYIITLLLLLSKMGQGQDVLSWTEFDTLKVYDDKYLVEFTSYTDSSITEKGQGFIYHVSVELRKSKWLPRFIKKTVPADSLILHGTIKTIAENGKWRVGEYNEGTKIDVRYYNSENVEISKEEFYLGLRSQWDREGGTNRYYFYGTKNKKR